jgi:hypothetical protein
LTYSLAGDQKQKPADKAIVEHLESVLYWTPDNAKAHIRLANQLMLRFEELQRQSSNSMPLQQVCEAAFDSHDYFHSQAELNAWLDRSIGERRQLLDLAAWHLRRGLAQCPLLGEGYIHLADVCFLDGADRLTKQAYLEQALKVRPNDGVVLLAAGSAAALRQDADGVLKYWRPVLRCREDERRAMVQLLILTQLPLDFVLEQFQPDLTATRLIYQLYSQQVPAQDLKPLLVYRGKLLETAIRGAEPDAAARLWVELHDVFAGLERPAEKLQCLRRAAALLPNDFALRFSLAQELSQAGAFADAESQLQWCAQRRPDNSEVKTALAAAVKGRIDRQTSSPSSEGSAGAIARRPREAAIQATMK